MAVRWNFEIVRLSRQGKLYNSNNKELRRLFFLLLFKFISRGVKCFGLLCSISFMKLLKIGYCCGLLLLSLFLCTQTKKKKKKNFAGSLLVVHWLFFPFFRSFVFCVFFPSRSAFYGLYAGTCFYSAMSKNRIVCNFVTYTLANFH